MTATVYLQIKVRLWWYGSEKARVAKFATDYCTGSVWQLPEPYKTDCLDFIADWSNITQFTLDDVSCEIEYRELWPVAGGWFTPSAPFDYEISKASMFGWHLTLTKKLTEEIKRAIKSQLTEELQCPTS